MKTYLLTNKGEIFTIKGFMVHGYKVEDDMGIEYFINDENIVLVDTNLSLIENKKFYLELV